VSYLAKGVYTVIENHPSGNRYGRFILNWKNTPFFKLCLQCVGWLIVFLNANRCKMPSFVSLDSYLPHTFLGETCSL
jgi:hypothetical protein